MEIDALAEELTIAGLTQEQAHVYVRLLQTGPAKVGQLSQYFDSSRSTLYRLLDELAERGYVTKSLERPTVYEPSPPEELFELSLDALDRTRDRLMHLRDKRLDTLNRLAAETPEGSVDHRWRRIEGTEPIYDALHEMIETAQSSVWSASNHQVSLDRYLPAVEEAWRLAFQRAGEDGLDVRLLFDFRDQPYKHVPEWIEGIPESFQLRQFTAEETLHFVLADREELLMWVRPSPSGNIGERDDVAVRTNAPGSVFAHRLLFDRLWSEGKPLSIED